MAIEIICPGCEADYDVPENLAGKTIRCKKCGETIAVKAMAKAKAKVALDDDDYEEKPRKATVRRRDEDDEDDDRPARKEKAGVSPVLIGGIAAFVLAVGGVGAFFLLGDKKDEPKQEQVANNDRKPADNNGSPVNEGAGDNKPANYNAPVEPKPEDKKPEDTKPEEPNSAAKPPKTEVKPVGSETKPGVSTPPEKPKTETTAKADAPKPATTPPATTTTSNPPAAKLSEDRFSDGTVPGVASGQPGSLYNLTYEQYRSGDLHPLAREKVKKASVYIFAESGGGAGTGSGWFGIEKGLVFTNAHVLHMTAPNAPPPKNIKFTLNSGTPQQRDIPHSKIKILAVDREIDLAVLQVINEPDLPEPLKVRPSLECGEGLKLQTVGYPFGAMPSAISGQSSGDPEVSIRPTQITAYRRNDYGQIRRIQIEGAANPGNSGGPVVDAEGTVCTVIVEGVHRGGGTSGIALTMGVPTEYCFGILAGRAADVSTELAYRDGDKVRIPVKVSCLDPLNRLKTVGIRAWIGTPATGNKKFRVPGVTKPKDEPGDRDMTEVVLKYDNKTKIASGEIILPMKPDGTVYWLQPYYANNIVTRYWQPGLMYDKAGDPAERVATNLNAKPAIGKTRTVRVSHASDREEVAEGEGSSKNQRQLLKFGMTASEDMMQPDSNDPIQIARARLRFTSPDIPKVVVGNKEEEAISKTQFQRIAKEFDKAGAVIAVTKEGIYGKSVPNVLNIQQPSDRYYALLLSNDCIDALQTCSVQMPNKTVQPGETWTWSIDSKEVYQDPPPADEEGRPIRNAKPPAPREYRYLETRTYKFIGIRTRNGRKEAMISIEGKIERAKGATNNASGTVTGYASVELDTGAVLECTLERDFEIDTSARGVKKAATALHRYKIERSATN